MRVNKSKHAVVADLHFMGALAIARPANWPSSINSCHLH